MKATKIKIFFIFLIALLIFSTQQQSTQISGNTTCDNSSIPALIQTGTFDLTRQSGRSSRVNTFQVAVSYTIPSSATGRINGYNQAVGTDYSIRASRVNQTNSVNFLLLINSDISWASIRANFIFSSRSDLIVGSFSPDTQGLFFGGSDTLVSQYLIPNWTPFSGNVRFALLISGLRTSDASYNVNLTQGNVISQTGLITLQVYSDANPGLQFIHISYVIVLGSAPFTFTQYNPLLNTLPAAYYFEGIDGFSGNSVIYEGYAMNFTGSTPSTIPCFGSNCQTTCISASTCTSLNGFINFNQCFLCGFEQVFQNNQCAPRCTGNQTWGGSSCVCRAGFTRVSGVCRIISCGPNSSFNGVECVCLNNFTRVGTQCICPQGYQIINSICVLIRCPPNSFSNGTQCLCNPNYIKIGSSCFFQCGQSAYLNQNGLCVCFSGFIRNIQGVCVQNPGVSCGFNEIYDSAIGKCVCRTGFLFSRNQCLPQCANFSNAVILQGTCVCLEGFDVVNGICVRLPACTKQNQILINGSCLCRSGFQYNSLGNCILNCQANQVLILESCQCITGFVKILGVCVRACSQNQILVNGTCRCSVGFFRLFNGSCARTCPINQVSSTTRNCICISDYSRNTQGTCIKTCGLNQILQANDCVCAPGWIRNSDNVCNILIPICKENEFLNGTICQCVAGYTRRQLICVSICRKNQIYDNATRSCVCREGYGLSPSTGFCEICPLNSRSTGLLTGCVCIPGYIWNTTNQRCQIIICQPNSSLSSSGECVCNAGFYLDGQECKRTVSCPARSTWDPVRLICVCTASGEFLINGICQPCQNNSGWNGTQCVCRTTYFLINGTCQLCSPNSRYIQNQCVCNFGFFGNGLTCSACHSSCGTCTGVSSSNCLTCVNASFVFSNGTCVQRRCDLGNYFNISTQNCKSCISYCESCLGDNDCTSCIDGFEAMIDTIGILTFTTCSQKCGDGKKFYLACDDGNKVNGDGCSSNCTVENGWTCVGGTDTNKSNCYNILPTGTKININGHVVLQGKVLQGISMTYVPNNLTANGCPQCDNILNVSVISSPIIPIVSVSYIDATQWKFVITFDFNNILGSFVFNFTVRINSALSAFFTPADMQQVQVVKIDMALLSAVDTTTSLSLKSLQTNDVIVQSSNKNQTTITIPGVPQQAVQILFPDDSDD